MSLAYWCLLIAGLLPYVWALVAKLGAPYDNHCPRDVLAQAQGHRKRANWAQANAFESLPLFIAAVLVASIRQAHASQIDNAALLFVLARIAHGLFYIADLARPRSLAWLIGLGWVVYLFGLAAGMAYGGAYPGLPHDDCRRIVRPGTD